MLVSLEWKKRFANPRGEGLPADIEVRPLYRLNDFPKSETVKHFLELGVGG